MTTQDWMIGVLVVCMLSAVLAWEFWRAARRERRLAQLYSNACIDDRNECLRICSETKRLARQAEEDRKAAECVVLPFPGL